jgi:hypothetical protein
VARPPVDTREWVSFEDEDEERTWVFDVTFLTSNWKCIFGEGCQGVLTGPAPELVQGCCSYGAHLIDKKDARRVEKVAKTLTADEWENHGTKKTVIHTNKHGELVTRLQGDACIFLNSPGFVSGPGCALHYAALKRGVNPMKYKPEVCWQLPLRREDQVEDDGHVVSTIRQWDRRHWGKGGEEFHWWCTQDPEAFVGTKPVYEEMEAELTEMVGAHVVQRLLAYLRQRDRLRAQRVALPHPAVRYPKHVTAGGFSSTEDAVAEPAAANSAQKLRATEAPSVEAPSVEARSAEARSAEAPSEVTPPASAETTEEQERVGDHEPEESILLPE